MGVSLIKTLPHNPSEVLDRGPDVRSEMDWVVSVPAVHTEPGLGVVEPVRTDDLV